MNAEAVTQLDEIVNRPSPQDVVGAIIAYSGLAIFPSDRRRLHEFVRQMKEKKPEVVAALLSSFVFSEGADLYPFSRTLENTLVHLQLGGVIFAKNPEFDRLGITDEARENMKAKAAKRFDSDSLTQLENFGEEFAKAFGETQ